MNTQTDQTASEETVAPQLVDRFRSPFALALVSGLMLWLALPTFPGSALSLLGWIAPLGWLALIASAQRSGTRPNWQIYAASLIHSLLVYQFIRLPHWSANFGWIALALYMACYPLAFVLISRMAVHTLRIPLVIAAPVVWTGLELFRGHFFYGLSTALLGHTQIHWTSIIQISDLAGAYAVSFLMMFVAACAWKAIASRGKTGQVLAFNALGFAAFFAAFAYGQWRISKEEPSQSENGLRVALIQGSIDTIFPSSEEEFEELIKRTHDQYLELSVEARQPENKVDLIVWPETMLNSPWVQLTDESRTNLAVDELRDLENYQQYHPIAVREAIGTIKVDQATRTYAPSLRPIPAIIGTATEIPGTTPKQHMNSAHLVDPDGHISQSYHKMHPVPFGEFIPFGEWIPALYSLAPISGPLTAGEQPESFAVNESPKTTPNTNPGSRPGTSPEDPSLNHRTNIAPSICFESIVPHLIRRNVKSLTDAGRPPDVLLNMTNDGWFWGSNALDLHLTCNAFRAVEMRTPMLVCANTGFSAEINGSGQIIQRGTRRDTDIIYVDVQSDGRKSLYLRIGDWPASICLLVTALFVVLGWVRTRLRPKLESRSQVAVQD